MDVKSDQTNDLNAVTHENRARELESHLDAAGFGFFHVLLIIVVGLATVADSVEVFGVSFVVPVAENELNITTAAKGWLIASVYFGMLLGGYTWGSFADAFGRKKVFVTAMVWNGVFGLISAFSPNFGFFMFFRFSSGLGIGGSLPVVYSYLSDFFTEKQTRPVVLLVTGFWQSGVIFPAIFAWGLLGTDGSHSEISFYIGRLHFGSWRLFLIICTLPAFASSIGVTMLPESPAYLFNTGKITQFTKVLGWIQKVNRIFRCCKVKQQADSIPLMSISNGQSVPKLPNNRDQSVSLKSCPLYVFNKTKQILRTTVNIFRWRYLRTTVLMMIIWFTLCFGYYGLQSWFPEFFRRLEIVCVASDTGFLNCTGNDTGLQFYQDTLYTALASLPGSIAGIILVSVLGARIHLVFSLILTAASVFTIWGTPNNHAAVVGVSCLFSAISVNVFGAQTVVNMAAYNTELRSTAFGVHSAVGRVGAILGNVVFGHLLDVDRGIPILIVASLLTIGAVCAVLLPSIYRAENKPPLERLLYRLGKGCKHLLFTAKKSQS